VVLEEVQQECPRKAQQVVLEEVQQECPRKAQQVALEEWLPGARQALELRVQVVRPTLQLRLAPGEAEWDEALWHPWAVPVPALTTARENPRSWDTMYSVWKTTQLQNHTNQSSQEQVQRRIYMPVKAKSRIVGE